MSADDTGPTVPGETRMCVVCGRTITWRKKWATDWASVKYCSASCRRSGLSLTDRSLEEAILRLLAVRSAGATICPSEAARAVGGDDWRTLMQPSRAAARRLVAAGDVEITQRGVVVSPSTAKGPIRIRRRFTPAEPDCISTLRPPSGGERSPPTRGRRR